MQVSWKFYKCLESFTSVLKVLQVSWKFYKYPALFERAKTILEKLLAITKVLKF
jgi:hypothetical protein